MVAQEVHAVGYPVDVLFDGYEHVAHHRRAAGAGNGEHVGKAGDAETEIGARAIGPFLFEREAAGTANIEVDDGAGHGIEAGSEHDAIEGAFLIAGAYALRRDLEQRRLTHIDQAHVLAIESFVITGVETGALGTKREIVGAQRFCGLRIAHDGTDLLAHELRRSVIRCLTYQHIVEGQQHLIQGAARPTGFIDATAFFIADLERGLFHRRIRHAEQRMARGFAMFSVTGFERSDGRLVQRPIAGRQTVGRRALEDGQLRGLLGDQRNRLDGRRAGADHCHALAAEIDALMGPVSGVIGVARETRRARNVDVLGH